MPSRVHNIYYELLMSLKIYMLQFLSVLLLVPPFLLLLMGRDTYCPWEYTEHYVTSKVQVWCDEIKRLSEVTETFPHAAYAVFTHGLSSHCLYVHHPDIHGSIEPLEEAIHQFLFQLFLVTRPVPFALPVRLGPC